MPESVTDNTSLLSNPVPSSLIDRDEPATPDKGTAKPATAADDQKAATPDATDENAETPSKDVNAAEDETRKQSRRQRKLQIERDARIRAETRAEMAEKALADAKQKPAAPESVEPKREDFEDYEGYLRAVTRYDAKQEAAAALKAEREAQQTKDRQAKTQNEAQKQADDWNKRETDFKAKVPTYEDDVMPFVDGELQQLSPEARRAIVEMGPDVLHHVAMNDELIDDLLAMTPLGQVRRLGRIDLSAKPDAGEKLPNAEDGESHEIEQPPPKPRKPEPPAPARHVRGGTSAPAGYSDDQATYAAQRKKEGARWAR